MKNIAMSITIRIILTILLWTGLTWLYQASNIDEKTHLFTHNVYGAIILSCIGVMLTMVIWVVLDRAAFEDDD